MVGWTVPLLAVGVAMFLVSFSRHACAVMVNTPPHSGSPLKDAADRLSAYLGSALDAPAAGRVLATFRPGAAPNAGEQGYGIRSVSPEMIEIAANTEQGAANGLYGLIMAARTQGDANPFRRKWDLLETPRWPIRRVSVAAFHMGLSRMTPDTWTFGEWKAYIDFLRQFNINYLSIMNLHLYHPEVPESLPNKWRFDVYREVIAYAHTQGMKVSLMTCFNQTPPAVFWAHPEWRTRALPGYFGHALCWSKAKEAILKYQRWMLEYLEGLDGLELMVTELLDWCACEKCLADPAGVVIDAVREYRQAFRAINPDGDVILWNWMLGCLPGLKSVFGQFMPEQLFSQVPLMQPRVLNEIPEDVLLLDLSLNQVRKSLRWPLDDPQVIEIHEVGPKRGRRTINFMFFMDREFGILDTAAVFPKPFLDLTMDEFEYTKQLPVEGISSYRLAPPGRFLSDFFFLRKSWKPDLTREALVAEAAGYLAPHADRGRVAGAIEQIERYWHKRERTDLLEACATLKEAAAQARSPSSELTHLCEGLEILALVDDYARTVREMEDAAPGAQGIGAAREAKLLACYAAMKQYSQFQGFTSDGFWEPRAVRLLLQPHMDLWAAYINHRHYYD